jgi:hypothetical protein
MHGTEGNAYKIAKELVEKKPVLPTWDEFINAAPKGPAVVISNLLIYINHKDSKVTITKEQYEAIRANTEK